MKTKQLLFGAAYYSEYLPYDRVEEDMAMMEKAGMNTIRIAESTWSTLEPQEGIFDFTHLDRMLDAAARHHISVIVGTPTYAIPTWLMKKYPDILAITHDGPGLYGHRQNMDITHPGYLSHAERMIRTLMEHIKDVPHIIGFQLDNETRSYDTCGPRVQAMFVEYLKGQFTDIHEFNHRFGLDYWSNRVNCWEDFPDVRGTINQSLDAEFKRFQRLLVTLFLSWQADIVSEYKRDDQFITQNFDFDWTAHSYGYQPEVNQYDAAKCMTVAGCDIYHPSQDNLTGAEITICGNISRSLKKENYLVLETEAQGNIEWLPYPGQLRLQAYSHIANGSNSVMYWHWHSIHNAIESYWKGVLSHDFSENETYWEAAAIGVEWKLIGSHLVNLKKHNKIAVMLDNASLTGLKEFSLGTEKAHAYNKVVRWLCDALYRNSIEYDMISSDEEPLCSYSCLIVPVLYSASEALLQRLSDYVKNGGHLITTFRSGFSDEYLKIYADTQPHILHECLGIRYDQFTFPVNVSVVPANQTAKKNVSAGTDIADISGNNLSGAAKMDISASENSPGMSDAPSALEWMDMVTCTTAVPLAVYQHPAWNRYTAVAKNKYGSGSTLYFATMFEGEYFEALLLDYLEEIGVCESRSLLPHFPVILKRGKNDLGKNIYYYFNYSGENQTVCHAYGDGLELLSGKLVSQGDSLELLPWDVKIVEV